MSGELKGFTHPLTPEGRAQLVGDFPWYFSSTQMVICYEADPAEVRRMLPPPFEPSLTEPAECAVRFGDWLFVGESDRDMAARNPERAQYKECTLHIRCRLKGVEARRGAYCWVDKDFALVAGLLMGVPKKLGTIHLTHSNTRLLELNRAIGKFGAGTELGGYLESHGERLITGNLRLDQRVAPEKRKDLPPPFGMPLYTILYFPPVLTGSTIPLANQVVQMDEEAWLGDVWTATDASLVFHESALEEHTAIRPLKVTKAYYMELATRVAGMKLLHEYAAGG